MKTIVVSALKGGVGKTTTCLNLARSFSMQERGGRRVVACDLDRTQRDLLDYDLPGCEVRAVTPGRLPGLVARAAFDFAVCDCPPALARESVAAIKLADVIVVPVMPEMPAIKNLQKFLMVMDAARAVRLTPLRVIVLFTMCDKRDPQAISLQAQLRDALGPRADLEIWPDSIRRSTTVSAANNAFQTLLDHSPRCEAALTYKALAAHLAAGAVIQEAALAR